MNVTKSPISKIWPATKNMTPTGASMMIHCVIFITMTVTDVKNFKTGSASSPTMAMATPAGNQICRLIEIDP